MVTCNRNRWQSLHYWIYCCVLTERLFVSTTTKGDDSYQISYFSFLYLTHKTTPTDWTKFFFSLTFTGILFIKQNVLLYRALYISSQKQNYGNCTQCGKKNILEMACLFLSKHSAHTRWYFRLGTWICYRSHSMCKVEQSDVE
jgi:hypothetical protein